jgi:hypothetical protein
MLSAKQMYGDKLEHLVQYTVGKAWHMHTPQALRDAERELQGVYRFLLWTGTADADTVIRLGNEQRKLLIMADVLEAPAQNSGV